jgi:hypothetical protein
VKRFLLVTALSSALLVSAQDASKPQLSVRLTSDRVSCSLRGNLQLEVVRENTGNASMFIYRRWEWGTFSKIRVFDSKGSEIKDVLWGIDDPPPLASSDFILLNPGEFLGTQLKVSATQFVKSPGDYEFLVEYRSYLSDDLARKHIQRRDVPFWSRERSKLTSNKIKLRITE